MDASSGVCLDPRNRVLLPETKSSCNSCLHFYRQKQSKINWLERKKNGVDDACYNLDQSLQIVDSSYNSYVSNFIAWTLATAMVNLVFDLTVAIRIREASQLLTSNFLCVPYQPF